MPRRSEGVDCRVYVKDARAAEGNQPSRQADCSRAGKGQMSRVSNQKFLPGVHPSIAGIAVHEMGTSNLPTYTQNEPRVSLLRPITNQRDILCTPHSTQTPRPDFCSEIPIHSLPRRPTHTYPYTLPPILVDHHSLIHSTDTTVIKNIHPRLSAQRRRRPPFWQR